MEQFEEIGVAAALELIKQQGAKLLDIRDPQSFADARAEMAFHLTDSSLNQLISDTEYETPLIVICYHGISSRGAAQYLLNQGFEQVYSLTGGFEAWRKGAAETVERT